MLSSNFKVVFFMGKGGVGKTTCAAAFALGTSIKKRTLIVSLDPAHNLGDVFGIRLSDEPKRITNNLYAIEVDFERMISKHLKSLTDKVKDIYGYLRVLNLDRYIDVLRHSPGIEEYATLDKIMEILKSNVESRKYDIVVFDTPPTGLTLRIMALPSISAIWVEKLMRLREAILDRRRIIEEVTGEKIKTVIKGKEFEMPSDKEEDPIYRELIHIKREIDFVNSIIRNSNVCMTVLIVNPEVLPIFEAKRALEFLSKLGINVQYVIVNKVFEISETASLPKELVTKLSQEKEALQLINNYFKHQIVIKVPLLYEEPKGLDKLITFSRYLSKLIDNAVV
ncbi:MAG: anion transporter [Desulfurococcales archaeon ex4484_42]|nr:MAG: anion transporter [Desulfurococcales archaeon ex4484_42]